MREGHLLSIEIRISCRSTPWENSMIHSNPITFSTSRASLCGLGRALAALYSMPRIIATVALACVGGMAMPASATITPDTQILFGGSNSDYSGTIHQNLPSNPTTVWLKYTGTTLHADQWNVDEESDWYLATAGQIF